MIGGLGGGHLSGTRITALLDGQLHADDAERAWLHVHGCHECRDRVEREGWLKRRLSCLSHDGSSGAPEALKGSLLGALPTAPGDLFMLDELDGHHRNRRAVGVAAIGGGALGAAVMGVLAFGAAPASAPTTDRPVPVSAVGSATPSPAPIGHLLTRRHH